MERFLDYFFVSGVSSEPKCLDMFSRSSEDLKPIVDIIIGKKNLNQFKKRQDTNLKKN